MHNANHVVLFTKVLQYHPNAEEKIGSSSGRFFIRRSVVEEDKINDVCCCYVRRTDGTEEDFKYYGTRLWKYNGMRFDFSTGIIKPDKIFK